MLLIIKHSVYLLIILGLIMIKQEKGNVPFMYLIEREATSHFIMVCKLIMINSVLNQWSFKTETNPLYMNYKQGFP